MAGPFSPGGSGLFRMSFTAVVDEEGVAWLDELGECELPVELILAFCDGDAVPELDSFVFFEALFESFARESCSC